MKLLVENKNISINKYYFRALLKQFQLVTSVSGRTQTDQMTVEKYIRVALIIILSAECNIVTIKNLKKLLFSSSHFLILYLLSLPLTSASPHK